MARFFDATLTGCYKTVFYVNCFRRMSGVMLGRGYDRKVYARRDGRAAEGYAGMKARSSVVERCYYMAEVGGSIPFRAYHQQTTKIARRARRAGLAVLLTGTAALGLAGCASSGVTPSAAATPTADATATYVIGAGDTLGVFVYEQPSLTVADLPVRPDGRISIPLADDVMAAGRTPAELAAALDGRLKKYVRDPNVTVMVHEFVGPFDRQIRVIGEAADPQAIAYRSHMTLLDVMIQTKGLTRFAAGNSAVIIRRGPHGPEKLHVHLSDLIKDGDISQNIEMQPGDTLIIPQSWF